MSKKRRDRRKFTDEFKADTVRLCHETSISQVVEDLDLTDSAVRKWVERAEVDAGRGPAGALTTPEREELARLRREVKRLEMERDILKKATVFFAKESR